MLNGNLHVLQEDQERQYVMINVLGPFFVKNTTKACSLIHIRVRLIIQGKGRTQKILLNRAVEFRFLKMMKKYACLPRSVRQIKISVFFLIIQCYR